MLRLTEVLKWVFSPKFGVLWGVRHCRNFVSTLSSFYTSTSMRLRACSQALCANNPCSKRIAQSKFTFILLQACARTVTSLALHRSTTPSTSLSSPRNAWQCCIIPARGAEQRRATLWRLAGLLRDTFLGSPTTRCCLLLAWVLLGPHDEHELQLHSREQGCFP